MTGSFSAKGIGIAQLLTC